MKTKTKGFTYIELVVTMLIFIALSLISYPIYTGVAGREQSKLAEGYALLGYIINAQVAYFNQYGNFLSAYHSGHFNSADASNAFTCNEPVLGINAINNRYFTSFNAFANPTYYGDGGHCKYHFTAIARSTTAGTVKMEYNLTKRFEPEVSGV